MYKTPFELWSGQKPDVSHLKVFGCEAFVHVPNAKRGQMESKAENLIFVGYDCGSKAYRFLNKQTNQITVTKEAKFLKLGSQLQEDRKQLKSGDWIYKIMHVDIVMATKDDREITRLKNALRKKIYALVS